MGGSFRVSVKLWLLQGFSEFSFCFSVVPVAEGQAVLRGRGKGSQAQLATLEARTI